MVRCFVRRFSRAITIFTSRQIGFHVSAGSEFLWGDFEAFVLFEMRENILKSSFRIKVFEYRKFPFLKL